MNPMKRIPAIRPPYPPINTRPLTHADAARIIKAVTCDDNVKALLEDVCQDDPGHWAVSEFLEECERALLGRLPGTPYVFALNPDGTHKFT